MRNIVVKLAFMASTCVFAVAAFAADDAEELKRVQQKVSSLFGEIEPHHIVPSPVDGWYTVSKGAVIAYISADGRYLLQGDMIDLDTQVNLSEGSRNQARKEMMSAYPVDQMIVFTPEEKRYSVSVFTDVDCTFCRRLHSQMDEYMAEGIEIRYLLYPRNGPTSESWATAEKVWCADDRNAALTQAKLDADFETYSCDPSVISTHYAMGQDRPARVVAGLIDAVRHVSSRVKRCYVR